MIALDWAHTRDFAVYDGEKAQLMPWPEALALAKEADQVAIEAGAPLVYLYDLARAVPTVLVQPQDVAQAREQQGLVKDDLIDAQVIYGLAAANGRLPLTLDDGRIRLVYLYHQYMYALKGHNATNNLLKAMRRHWGTASNATRFLLDSHVGEFERRMESLKEDIESLAPKPPRKILATKGMSLFLWAGILVFADPRRFTSKQAYRVYLGLVDRKVAGHKFNRNASRAYWLCADQFVKHRTPGYRDLYDEAKERLAAQGCTHPHGAAFNRVKTKFANFVFEVVKAEGVTEQGTLW